LILCIFFLSFCFGCADKNIKRDPFFEKWNTLAETSQGHSPKAESKKIDIAALAAKQAALSTGSFSKELPAEKINLTMRSADLKAVLRAMAKAVALNLLMKNDVKGEVSVDFRGVPWNQAFTGLLRTYGLSYFWEGNIIRVMTIDDIDRDLKQKVSIRDMQWVEPLLTIVVPIDYAIDTEEDPNSKAKDKDRGKVLKENLESMLTLNKENKPHGSIRVDLNSNSLIISAIKEDLIKIMTIIEAIDKPRPQILIKANIVETTKSVARDLGIMWGGYNKQTFGKENLYVTGGSSAPAGGIGGKGLGVNFPAANLTSTASGSLGLLFGTIGGNLLEVQLQALQKDSKLNILSSPSITTLDNQKAFTSNGEKVPYVTTETSGSTTTTTTKFEEVVMRLEITPHVIDGKNLKMTILVKKEEVDMTRKSLAGDPYIIKKETQTVLIVKDGETIVISGLTKQRLADGDSGWPWLKDIPLLGYIFKADSRSDSMEEVLIFITPHILPVEKYQDKIAGASVGESSIIKTETGKNNKKAEKN
jgi:type IV pilus assembly protein PilQ